VPDRPCVALYHAVGDGAVAKHGAIAGRKAGRTTKAGMTAALSPDTGPASIAAGEAAAWMGLETTCETASAARRGMDDVIAAAARPTARMHRSAKAPAGMHRSAAAKTAAADMHASAAGTEPTATAMKSAAARMEATPAATKSATAAGMEATAAAVEAAAPTTAGAAAPTAMEAAWGCLRCVHEPRDCACDDRGERDRNLFAAPGSQHVFHST
jgi:hypothetical protein